MADASLFHCKLLGSMMKSPKELLSPNRDAFAADPIGYSALAWHKWGMAQTIAGFSVDITKAPTPDDLKSPVLWLTQAHAMAEAARVVLENEPNLSHLSVFTKGVCDCQYCAVGLMLVGYSLEICLKAMLIMRKGIASYTADEPAHKHHRLVELAEFIPELSAKDRAILQALTHFVLWAGRYPDPGSRRLENAEEVFSLAEQHEITAKQLFELAGRVMGHSQHVVETHSAKGASGS